MGQVPGNGPTRDGYSCKWVSLAISSIYADSMQSLAWAHSIVPQSCGFLRLPFEVRRTIYDLVIESFSYGRAAIQPLKKGKKFYSPNWPDAAMETTALYHLCRQSYVDVVGSGLLYRARAFCFRSPTLMLNYLVSIMRFLTVFAPLLLDHSSCNHTLPRDPRLARYFPFTLDAFSNSHTDSLIVGYQPRPQRRYLLHHAPVQHSKGQQDTPIEGTRVPS
jgi:hypothetical protein